MLLENQQGKFNTPNEIAVAVSLGYVGGWEAFRKFGTNPQVPVGTADMWNAGGIRTLPTAAAAAAIVAGGAADTNGGTGAWQVEVRGLLADYTEVSEVVTLAGLTPVNTTNQFLRLDRMFVRECGSGGTNATQITASIGGNTQVTIPAEFGQSAIAAYTVPAGKSFLVDYYSVGIGRMAGSSDANIRGQIRLYNANVTDASKHEGWRTITNLYLFNGEVHDNDKSVTLLPEKTDIRIQVTSSVATQAFGIIGGYLIRNDRLG